MHGITLKISVSLGSLFLSQMLSFVNCQSVNQFTIVPILINRSLLSSPSGFKPTAMTSRPARDVRRSLSAASGLPLFPFKVFNAVCQKKNRKSFRSTASTSASSTGFRSMQRCSRQLIDGSAGFGLYIYIYIYIYIARIN